MKNLLIPVVAFALLTACGNDKKVDNKKPVPQQVPNGGQPMPPNPNGQGQPPRGPADPGGDRTYVGPPTKRPTTPEPATPQEPDVRPSTPSINDGSYGEGFTGAGADGYRDYFKAKLDAVSDPDSNLLNQDTAENIGNVRSIVDKANGQVMVGITFKDSEKEHLLVGNFEGSKAKLSLQDQQDSSMAIVGTLTCLDEDQSTCSTNHVRLKIGQSPNAAYVHILIRKTGARLRASLPDSSGGNAAFGKLLTLIKDTGKKVLIDSFEVINGRAAVTVSIAGSNNEVILGTGLLLKPLDDKNTTNIKMIRKTDVDYLSELLGAKPQLNIQKSITEMRLVSNDGKTTLGVRIKVGNRDLTIGLIRVAPALRSPSEAVTSEAL